MATGAVPVRIRTATHFSLENSHLETRHQGMMRTFVGGYDNPMLRAMHSIYITKNNKGVKKKYLTPMLFYSMIAKVHIA